MVKVELNVNATNKYRMCEIQNFINSGFVLHVECVAVLKWVTKK